MPEKATCRQCGYKWVPRVDDPIECPKCKSRKWKGENAKWDNLKEKAKGGD